MSGEVSFVLHSVEERESSDVCCTPDVQESILQGDSAFAMGSSRGFNSRDEAQLSGSIGKVLTST